MQGKKRHRAMFDGRKIARDMLRAGLTQRDLAKAADVSDTAVSRLVNGKPVGQRSARRVAEALGRNLKNYMDLVVEDDDEATRNLQISA